MWIKRSSQVCKYMVVKYDDPYTDFITEDERLVVIRFGRDHDPACMRQDEVS